MGAGICLDPHDPNAQWLYCPSYGAAIAFTVIFGIILVSHVTLSILYRKAFCWVLIMAVSWETVGFVFRVLAVENQQSSTFVTVSQLLILLSPLWINAFCYMILGRMAYYWLPNKRVWRIKARTLTKCFVWADVVSFLVQAGGGSLIGNTNDNTSTIGIHIYMGGIGLQQCFVVIFVCLVIAFHREASTQATSRGTSWRPLLYTLYLALLMISVRIIFRLIEFSRGLYSPIPTHEVYFYVLEAVPMMIAMGAFAVVHPGRIMVGNDSEFTKLKVVMGKSRWWCCGRRSRSKIDLDFELPTSDTAENTK